MSFSLPGKCSHDRNSPDYVPSVFLFSKSHPKKRKASTDQYQRYLKRQENENSLTDNESIHDIGEQPLLESPVIQGSALSVSTEDISNEDSSLTFHVSGENPVKKYMEKSVQTDEIKFLPEVTIEKQKRNLYEEIKEDKKLMNFYTGLPNNELFLWVLSLLDEKIFKSTKLSKEEHLLLVLMKLKLGLLHTDLAFCFGLELCDVSRIYSKWVKALSRAMKFLIIWPGRQALRKNLPRCFKNYKNCVCIIDCSEIKIERSFNLNSRAQTWSNYKHSNTIKYLIGITPAGAVSFLSHGWGGRVSDKEITLKSRFLDYLQHGDCILADRGFTIAEESASCGATLKIPHFTKGKAQMSGKEVDTSRRISNVRIHVERVIGRLRKFRILQSNIPMTRVKLLDDVMVIIAGLVNLNNSVVSK